MTTMDGGNENNAWSNYFSMAPRHFLHGCKHLGFAGSEILTVRPVHTLEIAPGIFRIPSILGRKKGHATFVGGQTSD